MDDVEFAFTASDKIGRLYRDGKSFSVDTPTLALSHLRGLASAFCDTLDRDFAESERLEAKITSLDCRNLLRPATRRNLRILQRNGNVAAHPESFSFEKNDFPAMAAQSLVAARSLIEQLYFARNEALPAYEITEVGDRGLREMCYQAMIQDDLEAIHQAGVYFKARADKIVAGETLMNPDGYGFESRADIDQAMFWFKMGSTKGHPDCKYQFGLYQVRTRTDDKEVHDSGQREIAWASNSGHADAMVYVAGCSLYGSGIFAEDLEYARELYELAAEQDHPEALAQLGIIHAQGLGCEIDHAAAARYTIRAAEAEFPQGQYNLFVLYRDGLGVNQDQVRALKWLQASAAQNYPNALFDLACCIRAGQIHDRSQEEAFQLFERCIVFPEYRARASLAIAEYLEAEGGSASLSEALTYLHICYESISGSGDPYTLLPAYQEANARVWDQLQRELNRSFALPSNRKPSQVSPAPGVKVGRNDLCWCGSGLKYKKCHGR